MKAQRVEDEPPLLGDEEDQEAVRMGDNQTEEQSLMDEMVAIAQHAKEEKRKQQEKERNRKVFGDGLKKGFFNSTTTKSKKQQRPKSMQSREERLRVIEPQESNDQTTANSPSPFVFPEVQDALNSVNKLNPKEWMNESFFAKLSRNPKLKHALQNPHFTAAIEEMQRDPQAAMLKYQKDESITAMLKDFMEFLGAHFEELGKQMEVKAQQDQEKDNGTERKVLLVEPKQQKKPQSSPAIVDLDEARRKAVELMPRSTEEEGQVQEILKNPALLQALSDGNLMEKLRECQQSPQKLQQLVQDPVLGPKFRLLVENHLVNFQ